MDNINNELMESLETNIKTLETKKRKTLADYGIMSMYQFIHNNAGVFDYQYTASKPTQTQIDKASDKQRAEYNKLLELRAIAEKYYTFFTQADCQLVLFYDRIMGYVHSFLVYEKIEQNLCDKLGQQEAMNFMLKVEEGLLIENDIADVRAIILASSKSFGIRSQIYVYAFYTWLDIIKELYSLPELDLFKDEAHKRATTAIYTIQDYLASKVCGSKEETTTKLKNITTMFETIPHFTINDYSMNKRQYADLKADAKAFKKGTPNTLQMSLFEMFVETQERLTNVYNKTIKGTNKQRK